MTIYNILRIYFLVNALVCVNASEEKPNVCKTFDDYEHMENNPNCFYNGDIGLGMEELCEKYGYPLENYTVTTEDGYILTIFRLARAENPRGVIFLQHPATTCSTIWINKSPKYSLGFQLYDAGYDVWLPNSRGTKYGRKHKWLSPENPTFWNHSFHEMCLYDIPAQLDLVNNITNAAPNISFIGHSMGAGNGLIYSILHPEHSKKMLNVIIPSAPHLGSNVLPSNFITSSFFNSLDRLWNLVEKYNLLELFPPGVFKGFNYLCGTYSAGIELCANIVYFLMGNSYKEQMKPEWYPLLFSQNLGVSAKTMWHFFLNGKAKRFQYFDYGPKGNMEMYNSTLPPLYDIKKITVPVLFVSGDVDVLCPYQDAQEAFEHLRTDLKLYKPVVLKDFSHVDFVFGRRINVYNKYVIKFLNGIFDKHSFNLKKSNTQKPHTKFMRYYHKQQ